MADALKTIDRRKYPRLSKLILVKLYADEQRETNTSLFSEAICKNISEGGISIEGDRKKTILFFRPGQKKYRLSLILELPGRRDFGKIQSKIVWIKEEKSGSDKINIGLEFKNLSPETKSVISSYIVGQNRLQTELSKLPKNFLTQNEYSIVVKRNKREVYNLIKNIETFPEFIYSIKYIKILERMGNRILSEWSVEVDGIPIKWQQIDVFNEKEMSIRFKILGGDFKEYEGEWKLKQLLTGTEVTFNLIFDLGMPQLAKYVEPIVKEKATKFIQGMLESIKDEMWVMETPKLLKFACVVHPLDINLFSTFEPNIRRSGQVLIEKMLELIPPFRFSNVTGIQSPTGKAIDGELILCTLLPKQIINMQSDFALNRVIQAGKLAEERGAKIFGLAAYTAAIGRKGVLVSKALNIPVNTGTNYTIAIAIEGTLEASRKLGIDLSQSNITVVGATGSIGSICSEILAEKAKTLKLVARHQERLNTLAKRITGLHKVKVETYTNLSKAISDTGVMMIATNTPYEFVDLRLVKSGAVICDISLPKNISWETVKKRKDLLVIDGGIVRPPGANVDFQVYYGLPPGLTYACMAETMILTLEERFESFSIGGNVSLDKVREINRLAKKHGFKLAELRNFGKKVIEEQIEQIRKNLIKN